MPANLTNLANLDERLPVIVGVGECTDRPDPIENAKGPLDLIAAAVAAAERDAGVPLAESTDSIDVIKHTSVYYEDIADEVRRRLRIRECRSVLGDGSGNGPLREMHNAALRIQRGETQVALICGSEAQWSVDQCRKKGIRLSWMGEKDPGAVFRAQPYANALALKYKLLIPTQVYPLYENATAPHWGQTPREATEESAHIWARMSQAAVANPHAWMQRPFSAQEVSTPTAKNRPLAWPYVKFMVAQPSVNLGSAIFLTSVGNARRMGVAPDRLVFLHGGAAAREPDDYLVRDSYCVNASQTAVMQAALALMDGKAPDEIDLYSCFPVVPKMARRLLGLGADANLTCAGGLTFFGAPVHNYMSHATAAMVPRLRAAPAKRGLLYGQGGNVTKHHALMVSGEPPASLLPEDFSVQAKADALRGPVPPLVDEYRGAAALETFTVMHDREGAATEGVLLLRTPGGERTLARVPGSDASAIARLKDADRSPVGAQVQVRAGAPGINECSFA
jgi:acetyl-CoA acetyltransferase